MSRETLLNKFVLEIHIQRFEKSILMKRIICSISVLLLTKLNHSIQNLII